MRKTSCLIRIFPRKIKLSIQISPKNINGIASNNPIATEINSTIEKTENANIPKIPHRMTWILDKVPEGAFFWFLELSLITILYKPIYPPYQGKVNSFLHFCKFLSIRKIPVIRKFSGEYELKTLKLRGVISGKVNSLEKVGDAYTGIKEACCSIQEIIRFSFEVLARSLRVKARDITIC